MKFEVLINEVKHSVFVGKEKSLKPNEARLRAIIIPSIDGVSMYPPLKEMGAETHDELIEMLGQWHGALANLKLD